jgi:hypothetical protein
VFWFWPANGALWAVASGATNAMQDRGEIIRLVRQWVSYDWLRVAVATVGFVLSVRAISVPFPAPFDPQSATASWRAREGEGRAVEQQHAADGATRLR